MAGPASEVVRRVRPDRARGSSDEIRLRGRRGASAPWLSRRRASRWSRTIWASRTSTSTANTPLVGSLNNALKAKELYNQDNDYIVSDGEVLIVDEFTGRVLEGRRYNEGMHQAIEAKERVEIKAENQTLATITLQNYFRLYDKLSGMTGTAQTEAAELLQIYKLGVVSIPTNQPMSAATTATWSTRPRKPSSARWWKTSRSATPRVNRSWSARRAWRVPSTCPRCC